MDINYLLFLQEFRNSINDAWTPFMEWISHFAVAYLMIVPAFIYWCIDKKKGLYIFASAVLSISVNSVVKLTACIYRPWVRDPRIVPAGDAVSESTGYSFPSGHTTTATPIYGGIAVSFGKKHRLIAAVCIIFLIITLFSRNYLGVHTPQDVIAGLFIGLASLYLIHRLFLYIEANPGREDIILIAGMILCAAALVYITLKPYPMEYVNGELLADPEKMKIDGYKDIGLSGAFCAARLIEKRFIRFRPAGLTLKGILISAAGAVPLIMIKKVLSKVFDEAAGSHFGGMLTYMLIIVFIIAVWPAVIRALIKSENKD